jgi:endonuclease I
MADAPDDQALRALETDLRSEFRLRNIEPPHEQIKSEMDRFVAHLSSRFEKLKRDDPDRVTEMMKRWNKISPISKLA